MKIAVVGATGLIGRAIIEHLQLSNWDVLAIASQRSAGQTMSLAGRQYFIYAIEQVDFSEIDWVFLVPAVLFHRSMCLKYWRKDVE